MQQYEPVSCWEENVKPLQCITLAGTELLFQHFLFKFSHFDIDSLSKKPITNLSNLMLEYNIETGQKEHWNTLWEWQQFS